MQKVRAIGLKQEKSCGLSLAKDLGISQMTACFHSWGILPVDQHRLKMCRSGVMTAGHSLRTRNGTWSLGEGGDSHLALFRALRSSSSRISSQ